MSLLLGIDLGTSYFKIGLFDEAGVLRGLGRVAVEKDVSAPGRSELPVERFWALLRRGLAAALDEAGAKLRDISALSYSSQANSFVLLDREAMPLTPLVLWTDDRGAPFAAEAEAFTQRELFRRTVGFEGLSGGFAVAKWRWFQAHQAEVWCRAHYVMTMADYFTFALTGERVGDASTAAFLGLYDLAMKQWWPEALEVFRVDGAQLSVPLPPGTPVGRTRGRMIELLGLPSGVPFAVGGLDHHVAALGSGLGTRAEVSISTGSVLAAMTLVSLPTPCAGCYHGPHFDERRIYRLAFDPCGAGQLEDYQRHHAPELTLEELLGRAADAPPGTGASLGIAGTNHGRAIRHFLEQIAATQHTLIQRVANNHKVTNVVATGGGARSALWLQIKADMFGVAVTTPTSPERACLGAAMLASVAAGWQRDSAAAVDAMLQPGRRFEPNLENTSIYRNVLR